MGIDIRLSNNREICIANIPFLLEKEADGTLFINFARDASASAITNHLGNRIFVYNGDPDLLAWRVLEFDKSFLDVNGVAHGFLQGTELGNKVPFTLWS